MKVCKMTTDPLLCSESRLCLSESRTHSGGALLVTLPLGKRLVVRVRAEQQHYHQSGTKTSSVLQDSNIHAEQMPIPIRRRNIHQTTLKPTFYWRCNIYLFFCELSVHKMEWGADKEVWPMKLLVADTQKGNLHCYVNNLFVGKISPFS